MYTTYMSTLLLNILLFKFSFSRATRVAIPPWVSGPPVHYEGAIRQLPKHYLWLCAPLSNELFLLFLPPPYSPTSYINRLR